MSEYHTPVLLNESITALIQDNNGIYADATFGGGGHSKEILNRLSEKGRLISFDRDEDALNNCPDDKRLCLVHSNFRFIQNHILLQEHLGHINSKEIDGVLADLGVSSHQFDTAERGFSFRYEAELDMRMSKKAKTTAADILNTYEKEDLEKIFKIYGEIDKYRKLTDLIIKAREEQEIKTTKDLQNAIQSILPKFAEHKFLAKIYQALRIEVNEEMLALEKFLESATASLKKGGRLVIISYHSLEDRMVKNFIKSGNIQGVIEKDFYGNPLTPLKAIKNKAILPSEQEISSNTRARSAKLRIAEKLF